MAQVSNFEQVRADSKTLPAAMTVREMLALGWGPSKVVALRWLYNSAAVGYAAPNGVHGIVVPGANFIAAILNEDSSGVNTQLVILLPDGSIHGKLENSLRQAGIEVGGCYGWFEPAMTPGMNKFGVVFQTATQDEFRCDVDAYDLRVLAAIRIR